jgi:hypothetical protein
MYEALCSRPAKFALAADRSQEPALKRNADRCGFSIAYHLDGGTLMSTLAISEGIDLHNLIPGSLVDVETSSRHYYIECLGGNTMKISGHPNFCPTPVVAELQGSVDGDGICENGMIMPGKHLVFVLERDLPVTTSKVLSVHVDAPQPSRRVYNTAPHRAKSPTWSGQSASKNFAQD